MRIIFVRHGDPDYEHDTLTEKGHREAALLGKLAPELHLGDCYMSPLGRAQHTAEYCLKATGKNALVKEWLQEFPATVDINDPLNFRRHIRIQKRREADMSSGFPGIWFPHIYLPTPNI